MDFECWRLLWRGPSSRGLERSAIGYSINWLHNLFVPATNKRYTSRFLKCPYLSTWTRLLIFAAHSCSCRATLAHCLTNTYNLNLRGQFKHHHDNDLTVVFTRQSSKLELENLPAASCL